MIRVRRDVNEPAQLPGIRAAELSRIRRDYPGGPPSREELGKRFTDVAEELWAQQAAKCCYCEIKCRLQGNDVEHYRPASRYWWLAWSWENLLFACPNCNRWAKNDLFPLEDPATRLPPEHAPPGNERPQLIDPGAENPMAEIVFFEEPTSKQWLAKARAGSVRGGLTVVLLKLNASDLVELRGQHVETQLQPEVARIRAAMDQGDEADVRRRWEELTARVLQRTMPYVALSHDVLDELIPAADRARWGLALTAPT